MKSDVIYSKSVVNEKVKGALAYLVGPVSGIILLIVEKKNKFVRFHAMQSTMVFGGVILLLLVLPVVPMIGWVIGIMEIIVSPIIGLSLFIIWVLLMWKAFNGKKFKLPYFGKLAEEQLEKLGE